MKLDLLAALYIISYTMNIMKPTLTDTYFTTTRPLALGSGEHG